jgi:hypothetical protein
MDAEAGPAAARGGPRLQATSLEEGSAFLRR